MCQHCDYRKLLVSCNLKATKNRLDVLKVVGNSQYPVSALDIFNTIESHHAINKVTVYRILDLLVDHGIIDRLSTGGRSFYYGMAPNENHRPHPHFYCRKCGQMDCLNAESLEIELLKFKDLLPGKVENVEIRVDGICRNCMSEQR